MARRSRKVAAPAAQEETQMDVQQDLGFEHTLGDSVQDEVSGYRGVVAGFHYIDGALENNLPERKILIRATLDSGLLDQRWVEAHRVRAFLEPEPAPEPEA